MDLAFLLLWTALLFPGTLSVGKETNQLDSDGDWSMKIEERKNPSQKSRPRPPFLEVLQSSSSGQDPAPAGGGGGGDQMGEIRGTLPLWEYVQDQSGKRIEEVEKNGIQCACDTPDCQGAGHSTCTTTGSCYTQILELDDGSPPITRGCITSGETPLLCENRIPKHSAGRPYPRLLCCKISYCNNPHPVLPHHRPQGDKVTPSPSPAQEVMTGGPWTDMPLPTVVNNITLTHQRLELGRDVEPFPRKRGNENVNSLRISPLAEAWLIGGAVSVVVISVIGFLCLRRERRRSPGSVGEAGAAGNVMNDVVTLDREAKEVKLTGTDELLLPPPRQTLDTISVL